MNLTLWICNSNVWLMPLFRGGNSPCYSTMRIYDQVSFTALTVLKNPWNCLFWIFVCVSWINQPYLHKVWLFNAAASSTYLLCWMTLLCSPGQFWGTSYTSHSFNYIFKHISKTVFCFSNIAQALSTLSQNCAERPICGLLFLSMSEYFFQKPLVF